MFARNTGGRGCEHASIDGWHVPSAKAYELFATEPPRRHSILDQLKLEVGSPFAFWTWLSIAFVLAFGILMANWVLVGIFTFAALFLAQSMPGIIRKVRHATTGLVSCNEAPTKKTYGSSTFWYSSVDYQGRRRQIISNCEHFETAIKRTGSVECKVASLPDAKDLDLVGFRLPSDMVLPPSNERPKRPVAFRPIVSVGSALVLSLLAGGLLAVVTQRLGLPFVYGAVLIGIVAGNGAALGGRSTAAQVVAAVCAAASFLVSFALAMLLQTPGAEISIVPTALKLATAYTFTEASIAFFFLLAVGIAFGVPRKRA